jgi:hypothetical protein
LLFLPVNTSTAVGFHKSQSMKKIVPARKFRRTSTEKLYDRVRIAQMHLAGWSSYKIADELGKLNSYRLDPSSIRKDIAAIEEEWRKDATVSLDRLKATQMERIKKVMMEAWESWERSKQPHQERTTVAVPDGETGGQVLKETRLVTTQRPGDPQYLQIVQWCIAELNKLFGLYARPDRVGRDGSAANSIESCAIDPEHAYAVLKEQWQLEQLGLARPITFDDAPRINEKTSI